MRLRLLLAAGVVGIAVASPAAGLMDGGPPRPPRCHGKRCARHRYELFAVTFTAIQRHVWTLPRGEAGVVNGCARLASGAGDMTLTFEAPRPTYALVAHGLGGPFFYWRSPSGATIGGFDVRASLEGFGWVRYEYMPVAPPCDRTYQVGVGSLDPADCRPVTITEFLLADEEARNGWLTAADASKRQGVPSSPCPIASYSDLLPLYVDGLGGPQELRLLRKKPGEPYASTLSSRKVFDCRKRTLSSSLPEVRRDTEGPVDGWGENDPNSPSWPHWHMTTTMHWKFMFRRISCGKR